MASPFYLFRKYQRAFIAIAAVVAMFIFVVADPLMSWLQSGTGPQRSANMVVATWDGGDITLQELDRLTQRRYKIHQFLAVMFERARQQIEQEGGSALPPASLPDLRLRTENPQAIQQGCVYTQVFADLARESGISVSDKFINHYLKKWGLGKTGDAEIAELLRQIGLSDKALFSGLRELLMTNLYTSSLLFSTAGALPEERWDDWKRINERIVLEAAVLPTDKFLSEVPDPSEATLKEYYEQYKDQIPGMFDREMGSFLPSPEPGFREPRKVKIQYLSGIVDDWTQKMLDSVTDEEIADYYERNKRTMFVKTSTSASTSVDGLFDDEPSDETSEDNPSETDDSEAETSSEEAADESDSEETSSEEMTEEESADEAATEEESAEAESVEEESVQDESAEDMTDDSSESTEESSAPAEETTEEASEAPADEDSSSFSKPNPFRLAAFQVEADDDGDNAQQTEADEESADDQGDEETPMEQTTDDDNEDEESVEYEPLENVSDQIRRTLALDKAVVELQKTVDQTFGKLQAAYNPYGYDVVSARTEERDIPEPPAKLSDYKAIASETGLASEETELLSQGQLSETFIGRAFDTQTRTKAVHQVMFGDIELYEPLRATDLAGNAYIVCKTEDVPSRVPEFDEVKDQVLEAWKKSEAAKLALAKAEELAKAAQESGDTIAVVARADEHEVVTTDAFSWMNFGATQAEMQRGPRLSEAPPLTSVDDDFMKQAFELEPNEKVALLNHDETAAYVIQLARRELTEDEMKKQFLSDSVNGWFGGQMMEYVRREVAQRQYQAKLAEQINLNIDPLLELLSSSEN